MAKTQPDTEILDLAISKEVAAYRLYKKMVGRTSDPQMKQALESLANEELEHKARLELELMKLGVVVSSEKSMISESLEDDSDELTVDMDFKDLLVLAIEKERSSLRLYVDLAAMTKDRVSREMLITLAEEEAMHGARFEAEYNMLMRKQSK
jgi:rubrerythrin